MEVRGEGRGREGRGKEKGNLEARKDRGGWRDKENKRLEATFEGG